MVFYSSHRRIFHVNLGVLCDWFIIALLYLFGRITWCLTIILLVVVCILLVQIEKEKYRLGYSSVLLSCQAFLLVPYHSQQSGIRALVIVDYRFE